MAGAACAPPAVAADRAYFIAADEVNWDYAPAGRDRMMGMPFDEAARGFVKARYREYMDETFTVVKPRPPRWQHLGLLGPVIRAGVGDTIRVVFRNNTGFPASVHPHGVFYSKAAEGSPYADGTTGEDKHDDAVLPGGQHTYRWSVPERAGPGPADPSSILWLYHSHVDAIRDGHSGLIGPILVTAKGQAEQDGPPRGVDRELITLFTVSDENESWYIDKNIATLAGRAQVSKDDAGFRESNRMHGINGYVYGNLPGLHMDRCQRTRWYVAAVGNEIDLHTPHWHGNAGLLNGHRVDVVELPAGLFQGGRYGYRQCWDLDVPLSRRRSSTRRDDRALYRERHRLGVLRPVTARCHSKFQPINLLRKGKQMNKKSLSAIFCCLLSLAPAAFAEEVVVYSARIEELIKTYVRRIH